jgi:hypothetical protein
MHAGTAVTPRIIPKSRQLRIRGKTPELRCRTPALTPFRRAKQNMRALEEVTAALSEQFLCEPVAEVNECPEERPSENIHRRLTSFSPGDGTA